MRFEELVLKVQEGEMRLRFHPELTILSGLGVVERQAFSESFLGALTGGADATELRYIDGGGRSATLTASGGGGKVEGRYDDGSAAPTPVGAIAPTAASLRSLVLVRAADLGVQEAAPRPDDPPELAEARTTLAELTAELDAVLEAQQSQADLRRRLDELDEQIAVARDGAARLEYAQVLAQLEHVRSEAAAVQATATGVEADRKLIAAAPDVAELAARWRAAAGRVQELLAASVDFESLPATDLRAAAGIPDDPPDEMHALMDAVRDARADRDAVDERLQALAVATLPAPSDPLVAELGLVDQEDLWAAAEEMARSLEDVEQLQVANGGLGFDDGGTAPAVLDDIEQAHAAVEDAARAAEQMRVPGVAACALGLAVALAGVYSTVLLVPVGMLAAAAAGVALLVQPKQRVAAAERHEREALARAGADTYLGFHIRRVDASIDPRMREQVALAMVAHRRAAERWQGAAGGPVDVGLALRLRDEVHEYHAALQELGGAADEIEQLRRDLSDRAEPALTAALGALEACCSPFELDRTHLGDLERLPARIDAQIALGRAARAQVALEAAQHDERLASEELDSLLRGLGLGPGELADRLAALEDERELATQREAARAKARPLADIEAEHSALEARARSLHRPEWSAVTAADAEAPDLEALEQERAALLGDVAEPVSDLDVERLADRQAAISRRVASLEARYGGNDANGDPGALADIQQHLLARLAAAGEAGPLDDPVPMVLDEAFLRVPADRKWDLLDMLLRLAERHQLIYLSDDAFVAAWARQQAADGRVILLEPAPA